MYYLPYKCTQFSRDEVQFSLILVSHFSQSHRQFTLWWWVINSWTFSSKMFFSLIYQKVILIIDLISTLTLVIQKLVQWLVFPRSCSHACIFVQLGLVFFSWHLRMKAILTRLTGFPNNCTSSLLCTLLLLEWWFSKSQQAE